MGVPRFFAWLCERYPLILSPLRSAADTAPLDCLYLDLNGVIHQASHPDDGTSGAQHALVAYYRPVSHDHSGYGGCYLLVVVLVSRFCPIIAILTRRRGGRHRRLCSREHRGSRGVDMRASGRDGRCHAAWPVALHCCRRCRASCEGEGVMRGRLTTAHLSHHLASLCRSR